MGAFSEIHTRIGPSRSFLPEVGNFARHLLDIHFNTASRSRENKTWDDEKAAEKKVRGFLSRLVKRRGGGKAHQMEEQQSQDFVF